MVDNIPMNIPLIITWFTNTWKIKSRGGVAIYISETYNFSIRHDLSNFIEGEFESIFIETKTPQAAIIGEIYRIRKTNIEHSLNHYEKYYQIIEVQTLGHNWSRPRR